MGTFHYDEQGEKKYLIYQKKDCDELDRFTMEMLSNNRIPGLVPFSYMQMDQSVSMRYNVTGLDSLSAYLKNTVKKREFLSVLDSICDAAIQAEDYMLDTSSYLFAEDYIFVDPKEIKASMVVLPVCRESDSPADFFRKLLFDVRYDQTEDCTYVTSLMNILRDNEAFSFQAFKDQVDKFKDPRRLAKEISGVRKQQEVGEESLPEKLMEDGAPFSKKIPVDVGKIFSKEPIQEKDERKELLDILFSEEEEEPEEKKKGLFSRKGRKKEKKEKKFFWKKEEKKEKDDVVWKEYDHLKGIKIPGVDPMGQHFEKEKQDSLYDKDNISVSKRETFPIPAQDVDIPKMDAKRQDFGETEYYEEDMEETVMNIQEESSPESGFILYRCSTQETFELKGDVIRIGRSPSISEICLSGNRGIGRIHAILYIQGRNVYIADNNSKNKTFVDGKQVIPGDKPRLLLSGSKIKLGDEELEFRISRRGI